MNPKFFVCRHCGNVIEKTVDSGVSVVCCGEPMQELVANSVDANREKHVPAVERVDEATLKVTVGSIPHPMVPVHHIVFIYLATERGGVRVDLTDKPEAVFCTCREKPVAVYEYCNLHGLWKTVL